MATLTVPDHFKVTIQSRAAESFASAWAYLEALMEADSVPAISPARCKVTTRD